MGETILLSNVKTSNIQPTSREEMYSPEKFNQLVDGYKNGKHIAPIRLRKVNGSYQCISGHMRLRATIKAGIDAVGEDDNRIIIEDNVSDMDADLETIHENHNREDLKWWEKGQQWRKFRELHGVSQAQLANLLPDVSVDVLKKIELGSKLADDPEMVIIITRLNLGYNSACHVARIPDGRENQKRFLECIKKYGMKVKDIDAYTNELAWMDGQPLKDLLERIYDEHLSLDKVREIVGRYRMEHGEADKVNVEDKHKDSHATGNKITKQTLRYVKVLRKLTEELPKLQGKLADAEVSKELQESIKEFIVAAVNTYGIKL